MHKQSWVGQCVLRWYCRDEGNPQSATKRNGSILKEMRGIEKLVQGTLFTKHGFNGGERKFILGLILICEVPGSKCEYKVYLTLL